MLKFSQKNRNNNNKCWNSPPSPITIPSPPVLLQGLAIPGSRPHLQGLGHLRERLLVGISWWVLNGFFRINSAEEVWTWFHYNFTTKSWDVMEIPSEFPRDFDWTTNKNCIESLPPIIFNKRNHGGWDETRSLGQCNKGVVLSPFGGMAFFEIQCQDERMF